MFKDPSRIELLVDKIFFENPTFSLHDYMTSALLDLRRAMTRDTQLVADEAQGPPPKLSKWLKMNVALPPWEAEFLYHLFADYPLSVIQGGSGCGKSSALIYVATYCARLVEKLKQDGKVPLVDKVLFAVDLQSQPEYLKTTFPTIVEQDRQLEKFLMAFCSLLDTELQQYLPDAAIESLFEKTFLKSLDSKDTVTTTPVLETRLRIATKYRHAFAGQLPNWASVVQVFNQEEQPHSRVVARYLLLQELARQQHERCSTRLVLVVDNIDPFPDYLQTALIRTFQAVTQGSRAHGSASVSHFSICLLARHSTATRRSGALDGVEAHRVQFRAADPADLIFYRLSAFLVAPEQFNTWNELDAHDQVRLSDRLWLLWQRLIDPQDQFSRVFSGLAGTNGRTACKVARWWLLSPRMQVVWGNRPADNSSLARATGIALSLRVAHATARAILAGGPCRSVNSLISELPERLFSNLLGILIGNHIVTKAKGASLQANDVRSAFSDRAGGTLKELFSLDPSNKAGLAAGFPVRAAVHKVTQALTEGTRDLARLRSQLKGALMAREEKERPNLAMLRQEDEKTAVAACMWLCEAIVRGVIGGAGGTLSDESVLEAIVGGRAVQDRLKPNRWESVSILINPELEIGRSERSALNVFSADGNRISPIALHILCNLQEAKHGLDALVIKERLELWGFEELEMRIAVRGMVEVDHRLVYSKVMDAREGTLDWFDAFHSVHISSAGSEYLKSVIPAPAYLQWALLEPAMLRAAVGDSKVMTRLGTGLGRIAVAFDGLRELRTDERQRLKMMGDKRPHEIRKSMSPALWVLFASLPRFIIDISGLTSLDRREAHRVAGLFLDFARSQYAEFQQAFGMAPDEWGYEWGEAAEEYHRRFGEWRESQT